MHVYVHCDESRSIFAGCTCTRSQCATITAVEKERAIRRERDGEKLYMRVRLGLSNARERRAGSFVYIRAIGQFGFRRERIATFGSSRERFLNDRRCRCCYTLHTRGERN